MKKIMTIVGTRPEIIKLSRVIFEMEEHTKHILVHTGQNHDYELHPIWLRERLPGNDYIDKDTNQRLYEPSSIKLDLQIKTAKIFEEKCRRRG